MLPPEISKLGVATFKGIFESTLQKNSPKQKETHHPEVSSTCTAGTSPQAVLIEALIYTQLALAKSRKVSTVSGSRGANECDGGEAWRLFGRLADVPGVILLLM